MQRIILLIRLLFSRRKKSKSTVAKITPIDRNTKTSNETPPVPEKPKHIQKYCWCLDNGHGALQEGKRSPFFELDGEQVQFLEWEFNRDIVVRITKQLKELGIAYYEVAPYPELMGSDVKKRTRRATRYVTDLPKIFVSVHANAAGNTKEGWSDARGVEVWTNLAIGMNFILAEKFVEVIARNTGWKNRGVKYTHTEENPIYVIDRLDFPDAILTENGFFTNKDEVRELMKDEVRQKIADAHVEAIRYFEGIDEIEKIV